MRGMSRYALVCMIVAAACGGTQGPTGPEPEPIEPMFAVRLVPAAGVSGEQIVNFAIPLRPGYLMDAELVRVAHGGVSLAASRVPLARYADGSLVSVQVQVAVEIAGESMLEVEIGEAGGGTRSAVPVEDTLVGADETPRVWAVLPAEWLAASGVFGPLVARSAIAGTALDAWASVCDYERWDTEAFLAGMSSREVWLFDRVTAMYRGHAITGEAGPLESGYREAGIYRRGVTGEDEATRIGVPGAADDLKYHYTQGLAFHYLMTGDGRYREAAENVAVRAHGLWTDPGYGGGDDFWTERHAGFALLAYEYAALVSDDRAAIFAGWAATAVGAYLDVQEGFPSSWTDRDARCFAHSATAHGEPYGYDGCSPWMSAILADGFEAHARRVGGAAAERVREGLVKLGRIIARDGRDGTGRPYYWMGLGRAGEVDEFDEHWGESAYLVAMAWFYDGRDDAGLRTAADELVTGLRERGEAGQVRSFNWQCRAAVQAPAYLR